MEHQHQRVREHGPELDPLEPIFAPLDSLLTSGGDARLHLDSATLLNGYGCRAFPRPEAYTFASSTATSISDRAYRAAAAMHQRLMDAAAADGQREALEDEIERLRARLIRLLGLDGSGHALVFSPSGTDSELQAVFVALSALGAPLCSVIAASDETGSGTGLAATGRHFSSVTSRGAPVVKGEPIKDIAPHAASLPVPLRSIDGALRPMDEIDRDVATAVSIAIASGQRVLLHAMDHSKLGWHCPSLDCVRELTSRWRGELLVVIDACQMRIGRARLLRYLDDGYLVQVTGSKFFTGPPFSGGLFVPTALAARLASVDHVPAGLADYSAATDWPLECRGVRAGLANGINLGQFLRWIAAEKEMDDFFAVPETYRRRALERFTSTLPSLIDAHGNLELLPECPREAWHRGDEELALRTNFPFFLRREGRLMPVGECTTVYRALNRDIAPMLAGAATFVERELGTQLCHIGQPVAVKRPEGLVAGALRISAGARIVSETWCGEGEDAAFAKLAGEVSQVRIILDKIQLILRHFDRLHGLFRD